MDNKKEIHEGLEEPNTHVEIPYRVAFVRMRWIIQESLLQRCEDEDAKLVENFHDIVSHQLERLNLHHVVHVEERCQQVKHELNVRVLIE